MLILETHEDIDQELTQVCVEFYLNHIFNFFIMKKIMIANFLALEQRDHSQIELGIK